MLPCIIVCWCLSFLFFRLLMTKHEIDTTKTLITINTIITNTPYAHKGRRKTSFISPSLLSILEIICEDCGDTDINKSTDAVEDTSCIAQSYCWVHTHGRW